MQDSMMMAEVGDIENVSGSRIATPVAPPSPGRTPISTPSRMPTSMNSRFFHVSATRKPCIRLPTSSTEASSAPRSIADQVLDRALRQRNEEPRFEDQKQHDGQGSADEQRRQPTILPLPAHERTDVQKRR